MKTSWLNEDGLFFEQNHDNRIAGLLFAQQIFAGEFPDHRPLPPQYASYRNGHANIWAQKPIDLRPPSRSSPSQTPAGWARALLCVAGNAAARLVRYVDGLLRPFPQLHRHAVRLLRKWRSFQHALAFRVARISSAIARTVRAAPIAVDIAGGSPPILIEVAGTYNIVQFNGRCFAIPHGLDVDWMKDRVAELPGVFVADSKNGVMRMLP